MASASGPLLVGSFGFISSTSNKRYTPPVRIGMSVSCVFPGAFSKGCVFGGSVEKDKVINPSSYSNFVQSNNNNLHLSKYCPGSIGRVGGHSANPFSCDFRRECGHGAVRLTWCPLMIATRGEGRSLKTGGGGLLSSGDLSGLRVADIVWTGLT